MKLIDLAHALENTTYADPPGLAPEITYQAHADTADQILGYFPGVARESLPGGEGWAVERARISTHNGTHLDAPYHYHSTMDGGKRAMTIDEVPLEWCIGRGVKLDFRHLPDGHVVTEAEISAEFDRIGHDLQPGDIVLVNTAAGGRLWHAGIRRDRMRGRPRRDLLDDRTWDAGLWHRRLELGRPLCPHS